MKHAVSYASRGMWLVDGRRGNWEKSHGYLRDKCGMTHREAVELLANANLLDCARDPVTQHRIPH